jgi:putative OPT family oligopeptide transporter
LVTPVKEPTRKFTPYITHGEGIAEFTIKTIIVGSIFGILFGAANAYLGLLVGITVSTSIPVAVMSVGFFRLIQRIFGGQATILESNISQTVGSASSSLASGIIFTIPALFIWGLNPSIWQMAGLALAGGLLGILFMIPLRRFLIKEEHEKLPYPEGTACAKVLISSETRGTSAKNVFIGLGLGLVYKFCTGMLMLWKETFYFFLPVIKKAQIGVNATPALLGVGYILGFRIASIMVAGGMISWVILIPLLGYFGDHFAGTLFTRPEVLISTMAPAEIWNRYIRYIGAGAVAFGGIITIIRSIPTMIRSFKIGMEQIKARMEAKRSSEPAEETKRTDRDIPLKYVFLGVAGVIAAIILLPNLLGGHIEFNMRLVAAPAIAIFAFFFVTVSSRIVGLIGVSSNPTSGMTIVTLLGISMVFVLLGWTDTAGKVTALTVGTVVCVAASIAGDTSQDLKTGFLLGATPFKQQIGELIGAATSALAVSFSIIILAKTYTFGSEALPAPQALLMKTIIEGVLEIGIPWGLVLIGVGLAIIAELFSIPSLPFAVGLYLPVSTMTPIFMGGAIRKYVEWKNREDEDELERRNENGVLFGSGLIGGQGFATVIIAFYAFYKGRPGGVGMEWPVPLGEITAFVIFAVLGYILFRRTRSN